MIFKESEDMMLEYLPEDIRRGLETARKRATRKGSRLCVHVGEQVYPILTLGDTGFTVDMQHVPKLRGLVDIYDGPRHLSHALIIAASEDGQTMTYDFKRESLVSTSQIRDYVEERDTPAGYLATPT